MFTIEITHYNTMNFISNFDFSIFNSQTSYTINIYQSPILYTNYSSIVYNKW